MAQTSQQQRRAEHYTTLTDPTFLAGLESILQPFLDRGAPEQEIRSIAERAEAFYLSTHAEPDLEQPQPLSALAPPHPSALTQTLPASSTSDAIPDIPATASAEDQPPYPQTFAELAQLIATGAPVPGIKDIPDQLAAEPPTESTAPPKRKPWEGPRGDDNDSVSAASSGAEARSGGGLTAPAAAASEAGEREQASREVAKALGLDAAGSSGSQDDTMRDP